MRRLDHMDYKQYFHYCSDGSKSRDFILGRDDFVSAMNIVALCAANTDVVIVAFSLEDTHPHFLLYGTVEECSRFKVLFESTYMRYACRTREGPWDMVFDGVLYPVGDDIRYLRNVAAYVVFQPTKDGKRIMPQDYLWGSGSLYFRSGVNLPVWYFNEKGRVSSPISFGSLSNRERIRTIHSKSLTIPSDWTICNGIVLPSNYVDVARYEGIFESANCFRVFLSGNRQREEEIRGQLAHHYGITMEDSEARLICSNECENLFGFRDIRRLEPKRRIILAQLLRRQYRLSFRQISALVRLPEPEIRKFVP